MKLRRLLLAVLAVSAVLLSTPSCRTASPKGQDSLEGAVYDEVERILASVPYRSGPLLVRSIDQIVAFGKMSKAPLRDALSNEHPQIRTAAAFSLGRLGDPEAIGWLRDLERDPDAGVRYEAASSRIGLGDWSALGVLISGLRDQDRMHRYQCFEVLTASTGLSFGYDFAADSEDREEAALRWEGWWNEVSAAPRAPVSTRTALADD